MSSSDVDSDFEAVVANRRQQQQKRDALFGKSASSSVSPPPSPPAAEAGTSKSKPPVTKKARARPRYAGDGESGTEDLFNEGLDNLDDAAPPRPRAPRAFGDLSDAEVDENARKDDEKDDDDEKGDGDETVIPKKKRIVARLDEARLSGPAGFPQLQKSLSSFKTRGKGHEADDLRRLMTTYQLWAHGMFPKTNLKDTLGTVERLCRKRSMLPAMRQFRDLAKYGPEGRPVPEERNGSDDDEGQPQERRRANSRSASPPALNGTANGKGKERAKQSDEFDDINFDDGFDGNDDDLFAEENEALLQMNVDYASTGIDEPSTMMADGRDKGLTSNGTSQGTRKPLTVREDDEVDLDGAMGAEMETGFNEEDEAMMREMEDFE